MYSFSSFCHGDDTATRLLIKTEIVKVLFIEPQDLTLATKVPYVSETNN